MDVPEAPSAEVETDANLDYKWPRLSEAIDTALAMTNKVLRKSKLAKWMTGGQTYVLKRKTPDSKTKKGKVKERPPEGMGSYKNRHAFGNVNMPVRKTQDEEGDHREVSTESVYLPPDEKLNREGHDSPTYCFERQSITESFSSTISVELTQLSGLDSEEITARGGSEDGMALASKEKSRCRTGSTRQWKRRMISDVLHAPVVEVKPIELPDDECPVPEWKLLEDRFPRLRRAMENKGVWKRLLSVPAIGAVVDTADNLAWKAIMKVPVLHDYVMDELVGEVEFEQEDDETNLCEPLGQRSIGQDRHLASSIPKNSCMKHDLTSRNIKRQQEDKPKNLKLVRVKRKCRKQASSSILQAAFFVNYCKAQALKIAEASGGTHLFGGLFGGGVKDVTDGRGRRDRRNEYGDSFEDDPPCFAKLYSNDSSGPASSWEALTSTSSDSPT